MKTTLRSSMLTALFVGSAAIAGPRVADAGPQPDSHALGTKDTDNQELSDGQILGVVDTANTSEIDQANVAITKAEADSVKEFAQMMIKDHTAAKERDRALAAGIGISVSALSAGIQKESNETMTLLMTVQPSNFDRTYMQTQVRAHQKVLRTLDELVPQAASPQLKTLLTDMRATVERHLTTAEATLAALGR